MESAEKPFLYLTVGVKVFMVSGGRVDIINAAVVVVDLHFVDRQRTGVVDRKVILVILIDHGDMERGIFTMHLFDGTGDCFFRQE